MYITREKRNCYTYDGGNIFCRDKTGEIKLPAVCASVQTDHEEGVGTKYCRYVCYLRVAASKDGSKRHNITGVFICA